MERISPEQNKDQNYPPLYRLQVPVASAESGVQPVITLPADLVPPLLDDSTINARILIKPLPLNHLPPARPLPFIPRFPNVPHPLPVTRAPMFRIRLPMPEPAVDFPHPGAMEAEHWNGRPFRDNWNNGGPPRGPPEWFGPEPLFRHAGWSRGHHWGHRQFRN